MRNQIAVFKTVSDKNGRAGGHLYSPPPMTTPKLQQIIEQPTWVTI